jgi:hypothetical protein
MKKILLLLLISIGLISLVYYELQNDKATTAIVEAEKAAILEAEKAAILDAELAVYEADLLAKLALQEKEAKMARQAALDAFQANLAADKAAAAASTAAYQDSLLDAEFASFEAQLAAELASQEMMAEIQAEMARQAALDAFQAKLAADKAAAAKSTAAYQAKLASEAIEKELDELEAQLMEELLEESTGIELTITRETHNLCRSTLGLSEINIQLYNKALLGGYLGSIGPQVENGTEFSSTRWDNYISCISSLNSEL